MKIQICYENTGGIEGFEVIETKYGLAGLQEVTDHSSEEIYITECIDRMEYEESLKVLSLAVQKLRLNGKLSVNGTDLRSCCTLFVNDSIDSKQFSSVIKDVSSLQNCCEVEKILKSLGVLIDTSVIKGTTYEIKAIRQNG